MSAKLEMSLDDIIKIDRKTKKSTPRATPNKDKAHHPIKARKEENKNNNNNNIKNKQGNRRAKKQQKISSFRMENRKNLEISITNDRVNRHPSAPVRRDNRSTNDRNSYRSSSSSMMVIDREGGGNGRRPSRNERPSNSSRNLSYPNSSHHHQREYRPSSRNSGITKP